MPDSDGQSVVERREFAGFIVAIESPVGSIRRWQSEHTGRSGQTLMRHDYGYLIGVPGNDGDELDVYLGPVEAAPFAYVVHQMAPPDYRSFEEDKLFLGFPSEQAAVDAFKIHRDDGDRAYGGMTALSIEELHRKLARRTGSGKVRHHEEIAMLFKQQPKAHLNLFHMERFDVGEAEGPVSVDVWDRFTSWGEKIKNGRKSVFDEATLGQMIDNWYARRDPLSMCFNHQSAFTESNGAPAPAAAWYDAMAIVRGGAVLRFVALDGSRAAAPDAAALGDGLYGFRCEVTAMGHELLRGFKFISPMFTEDGKDERGRPIGYVLYDVAATNTPFQAGCEITFNSGARAPEGMVTMAAKLGKLAVFAKLGTDAEDKAIHAGILTRMAADKAACMDEEGFNYAGAADEYESAAKAYEDAHYEEDPEGEPPPSAMRKLAAKMRRMAKMAADAAASGGAGAAAMATDEKEKEQLAAYSAVAKRLGIQMPAGSTSVQIMEAITASTVSASEIPKMVKEQVNRTLLENERVRVEGETKEKAKALVAAAELGGYPKGKSASLLSFASNPQTYDAAVAIAEPFTKSPESQSILFSRMTGGGAPLGVDPRASAAAAGSRDRKVFSSKLGVRFVEDGGEFSRVAIAMAAEKGTPDSTEIDALLSEDERKHEGPRLYAANVVLKKKRPDLWSAAEEQFE